jgi:type IV secretory pathway VirB4 component
MLRETVRHLLQAGIAVVLQRDGSLLAAWQYRGPDLHSATHAEMAAIARRLNRIFRLGRSWMIQVDSFRANSSGYPSRSSAASSECRGKRDIGGSTDIRKSVLKDF